MFQGNWKCSSCGGAITELPFEPRSEAGLTCRTCYAKRKEAEQSAGPPPDEMAVAGEEQPPMPEDAVPVNEAQGPAPDSVTGATPSTERTTHTGDWQCSMCGAAITSLPFEPRSTNNLKCIDCFKKSKG